MYFQQHEIDDKWQMIFVNTWPSFLHNFKPIDEVPCLMLFSLLWLRLSDRRCFVPVTISLVITGIRLYARSIWFSRYGIHFIVDEEKWNAKRKCYSITNYNVKGKIKMVIFLAVLQTHFMLTLCSGNIFLVMNAMLL